MNPTPIDDALLFRHAGVPLTHRRHHCGYRLVVAHQTAVTNHVGGKDRRKSSLHALVAQMRNPTGWNTEEITALWFCSHTAMLANLHTTPMSACVLGLSDAWR